MQLFVEVVESGSLAGAAHSLGLSPPSVTRSLQALEERLGTRLLHRTTRSMRLTEAGERYLEDCRRILGDLAEAEESLTGDHAELRGKVTVTAPVLFGELLVMPILRDFLDLHSAVSAQVLLLDRIVNLAEEGIDIGVRLGELPDSSLYALKVGEVHRVICASPNYLQRHGRPERCEQLRNHQLISTAAGVWKFRRQSVRAQPRLIVNSNQAAVDAAAAGWGIAHVVSYQVAPKVAAGELVCLLSDEQVDPWPVHLITQEGRRMPRRVRALLDHLREGLVGTIPRL